MSSRIRKFMLSAIAAVLCVAPCVQATAAPIVPNDEGDDTAAIQAELDSASKRATAHEVKLPSGRLVVSETLKIKQSMGLRVSGSGGQNRSPSAGWDSARSSTILAWTGPADKPILELEGCTGLVLTGVNFTGKASHGVLIRHGNGSLNIAIRDCGFVGPMKVGIQCGTEYGEQTCANIIFDQLHVEGATEAAVRIVNAQSLEHLFLRPKFANLPIAIDCQAGGDISVFGGGTYEVDTFVKLGRIGSNTRSFDFTSVRFDGKTTRTAWIDVADTDAAKTYGSITFANCGQNNGQKESPNPLVKVAPGSRVVLRECSFNSGPLMGGNLAHIYSDRRAGGELVVENCDGLDGTRLAEYVQTKGNRAYFTFIRCGDLYTKTGNASNFPEVVQK